MTEEALGTSFSSDQAALRAIYRTTVADVFGLLMFRTGGNRHIAEDLLGQTYLEATNRYRQGRGDDVTIGWLKTVAQRRFIDHLRRQTRVRRRAEQLQSEIVPVHVDLTADLDTQSAVATALDSLPNDHRLVLILRHVDGLSADEIADVLGRSYKATESLLGRARSAFRAVYGGELDG